ncbi:MAG: hypothetical protein NC318_07225 [Blautia sp.]|nr:hypothetical protein [Blautia sp.]
MVAVLLSWLYIACICTLIGLEMLGGVKSIKFSWTHYLVAGMIGITVYAQFFSIFGRIGAVSHILLFAIALFCAYRRRDTLRKLWKTYAPVVCSWEGLFYACFILGIAFFTSRGEFHTDTNIYHAAAIRLYEEYGLIKGVGNLQLHFAYNSSYLAFAAMFSLRWLLGHSLHTTTGFLEVVMCLYAFHGLKDFKRHENHIPDMMKIGILFYTLVNITRSMSPATDYAVMFFVFFILTAWCEANVSSTDIRPYALLSIAAVFVATLKFSACMLVLLAVYPAVYLIKEKKWKDIAACLLCGCVILCPFLVRNYLISGWLLYPFEHIDIFHPEWKIPKEYLLIDANQIKVWGRCLYDTAKVDLPISKWLPVWWEHQFRYEQMFLGAVVLGAALQLFIWVVKAVKKEKFSLKYGILHITIWANILVWFLMAPFIRYGLAFLFAVIMLAVGECISMPKKGFASLATGGLLFCILVSVSPYWDQYVTDAGVFVKQNLKEPYYITQKDYDSGNMQSLEINGNTIYYAADGIEINSYHVCPGTCYPVMLERSTLIGDNIEDGFRAK